MSLNVLALIVVYGEVPLETISFKTLAAAAKDYSGVRFLIWDNSQDQHDLIIEDEYAAFQINYAWTPENTPLSTIYNRVIANDLRKGEYLLLLDQDTSLPSNFFATLECAIQEHPEIDLFLPMIQANERWVSPVHYFYGWGRYWPDACSGLYPSRNTAAINSGMVIAGRYLKGNDFPGYDEVLRFYGTDTQFMVDYTKRRDMLVVLDAVIQHDLSFFSADMQTRVDKFLQMKRAHLYVHARAGGVESLLTRVTLGLVSMVYAMKYRSWRCLAS